MKHFHKLQPITIPALIILTAAIMRLLPHPPNFAPIGALALFSGTHLGKKSRFILPLSAMIASDIFLGFDAVTPVVYLSFILIIMMGLLLKNKTNPARLVAVSLLSSLLFFILTNFGVWALGSMYAKNLSGLLQAYVLAIPFFRNTILSDLLYSFAFFYGYRFVNTIVINFLRSSAKSRI